MEELDPGDLDDLVQELEEERGALETPAPEGEELLHVLPSGGLFLARQDAAEQPGKLATSSPRRVKALQPRPGSDTNVGGVAKTLPATETHAKMLKDVRSWGLGLLGIGVLSLILSGLSASWGVVLVVAGLASFVFRETPMFVVYGTILTWAAINNLMSGQVRWIAFAVFQLVLAFQTFRKYALFRRAEKGLDGSEGPQRASRAFPQIGCGLGAVALVGLVGLFVVAFLLGLVGVTGAEGLIMWLESLVIGLAVLGLSVATASLLSGYRHKLLAILGIAASALVLLIELAFALIS